MANETKREAATFAANEATRAGNDPLLIDEFDIIELEDRLEFADRCNGSCAPK